EVRLAPCVVERFLALLRLDQSIDLFFGVVDRLLLQHKVEEIFRDIEEELAAKLLEVTSGVNQISLNLDSIFLGHKPSAPQERNRCIQRKGCALDIAIGDSLMQVFKRGGERVSGNFAAIRQLLRDVKIIDQRERRVVESAIALGNGIGAHIVEK